MTNNFLEDKVILNCKVAFHLGKNLSKEEISLLKHIHVYGKLNLDELENKEYHLIMKNLERRGICYEDPNHFFHISNQLIGSIIFSIYTEKKKNPIENIQSKNKVEIAVEALKRIDKRNLLKANNFFEKGDGNLKEDQWVNEFFGCLKSLSPGEQKFFVLSPGTTEIHEKFVNEIDLYIDNEFNKGFEVLREGIELIEHILRKYRVFFPDRFKDVKFKRNTAYYFPLNAEYLVIDIRSSKYYKLKNYILDKNNEEVDLKDLDLENDLMRVIYNENIDSLEVHYREKKLLTIDLPNIT